jgi:hypothetical protein
MSDNITTPELTEEQQIIREMQQRIIQLEAIIAHPIPFTQASSTWSKEPKIESPPPFSGRKDKALEFLLKCDMVFDVQPRTYSTTKSKIAFVTNLLKDEAYHWVMPHLTLPEDEQPIWLGSWVFFKQEFKKVFGDSDIIETSRQKLKGLKQTQSATSYATEFTRHCAYLHWGDEAFRHAYFDGLKEDVKDKLLTPNEFKTLVDLIDASVKWDNLLYQRRRTNPSTTSRSTNTRIDTPVNKTRPFTFQPSSRPTNTTSTPASSTFTPVPMEVDAVRPRFAPLTTEERKYRMDNKLCMYCGKTGHIARDCRAKSSTQGRVNANTSSDSKNSLPQA